MVTIASTPTSINGDVVIRRGNVLILTLLTTIVVCLTRLDERAVNGATLPCSGHGAAAGHNQQVPAEEEELEVPKRAGSCPPWKPFQCPEGTCIPLKYLCDYNIDCPQSQYDENKKVCTAAVRPTVESTVEFLSHQLQTYGPDYFVKLLGAKAGNSFGGMGGVAVVAVALTESPGLNDFASSVGLTAQQADRLRQLLKMLSSGDKAGLKSMGINEAEIESLQPIVEQLVDTGFLKTDN